MPVDDFYAPIFSLTTFVEIINPTDVTQTLNVGTKLGKISEYDDIPIPLFQTNASGYPLPTQSEPKPDIDIAKLNINPALTGTAKTRLHGLSRKYIQIFQWESKALGRTKRVTFDIKTGDAPPIKRQQFPHPDKIHNQIREHVDKMMDLGIVKPIQSDWSCPCFLAPKKKDDGTLMRERIVIDVRGLNTRTKTISYPSVRMEDILKNLRNSILRYIILRNLIIWSETEQEHLDKIQKLFAVLANENLKPQPKKCSFMFNALTILGVLINSDGVSPEPLKLTGVSMLQTPPTTKECKRMYGLLSYFRKFIPNFAKISHPITTPPLDCIPYVLNHSLAAAK
jgi:hypothetical protein